MPSLLLIEDNPADVLITQRALRNSPIAAELRVARDGQEALEYLLRQGPLATDSAWRRPDLILLDLNLPRLNGLEVLQTIRATPGLRLVPVVVLTTSNRQEDVRALYAAGANTYIEKPQEFARFATALETVLRYWFETALLPPAGDGGG